MIASPRRMLRPTNLDGIRHDPISPETLERLLDDDHRLGLDIKALRRARGITLEVLGEASGLSKGYLSQIERGTSSPSVKALHSISRALGVTISWFFPPRADADQDLRGFIVRADARRKLHFVGGIVDELLSPDLSRNLELLRCVFPPDSHSGEETYHHDGEEAGIVMSGELNLWIGDRHVVLSEGDSFAFPSDLPHRYANTGTRECVVIWAITPPTY